MKTVITYGTFDLLHIGHVNMLKRLKTLGDRLIVGVSTDDFNLGKGKQSIYSFEERSHIVSALGCVDLVIPENNWEQKTEDIKTHAVDIFGIGEDWAGKFDYLNNMVEVVYLPRTPSISTTQLKTSLSKIDSDAIRKIKQGLDNVLDVVKAME